MHIMLGMFVLLGLHTGVETDSLANPGEYEQAAELPSAFHVIASTYGTFGTYSTETNAYSSSGYATLTNSWRDYYSLGYVNLWLDRSDQGESILRNTSLPRAHRGCFGATAFHFRRITRILMKEKSNSPRTLLCFIGWVQARDTGSPLSRPSARR